MEARMLLKIGRHPLVVRFLGQCVDGEDQLLITEFAPLGSLTDAFETLGDKFTLAHSVVIMQQIEQAMEHLISQEILHCDLAARNALVFAFDENNVLKTSVKLSDYGLSAGSYNRSHITVASEDRPIRYMPPEALQKGRGRGGWAEVILLWGNSGVGQLHHSIASSRLLTFENAGGNRLGASKAPCQKNQ